MLRGKGRLVVPEEIPFDDLNRTWSLGWKMAWDPQTVTDTTNFVRIETIAPCD